jgi:hypothetical protein
MIYLTVSVGRRAVGGLGTWQAIAWSLNILDQLQSHNPPTSELYAAFSLRNIRQHVNGLARSFCRSCWASKRKGGELSARHCSLTRVTPPLQFPRELAGRLGLRRVKIRYVARFLQF